MQHPTRRPSLRAANPTQLPVVSISPAKQGFQSGFPGFEKNSAKTAVSLKRARIPNSRACIAPACDGGSGRRSSACESKKLVHDWCSTVKPVELELRSGLGERT